MSVTCFSIFRMGSCLLQWMEKVSGGTALSSSHSDDGFNPDRYRSFSDLFEDSDFEVSSQNGSALERPLSNARTEAQRLCKTLALTDEDAKEVATQFEWCCPICLDNSDTPIARLPCSHSAHTECLELWFVHGRKACPLCQSPVETIPPTPAPPDQDIASTPP